MEPKNFAFLALSQSLLEGEMHFRLVIQELLQSREGEEYTL